MNATTITIKTQPEVKQKAQQVAKKLGVNLNYVINILLQQFVKTKQLKEPEEIPNAYLRRILKKGEKNRKTGKGSPIFDNAKDAIHYLEEQGI